MFTEPLPPEMSDVCRVCLEAAEGADLVSLFEPPDSGLPDKIMRFASVTIVPGDELPSRICVPCADRLNASYAFKLLCENSDRALRENVRRRIVKLEDRSNETSDSEFDSTVRRKMPKIERERSTPDPPDRRKARLEDCEHSRKSEPAETDRSDFDREEDRLSSDSSRGPKSPSDAKIKISDRRSRKKKLCKNNVSAERNCDRDKKEDRSRKEQCSTCGKVMSSRFRLKMHLRIHTGEKPFTCNYCDKKFALSQNLKVHQRVHTGEKPLLCGNCGKAFAQSAGLVAHMRLHTGETPYKCSLCPMSFRTPGHLQYHKRQHTGEKKFECSVCNKAFIMRSDLTQHAKTHTGERRYVCTICGLRMSRSSHLTRHMMIHTGEKPHKCNACGSSYAQKADLARHAKRHPGGACKDGAVYVKISL